MWLKRRGAGVVVGVAVVVADGRMSVGAAVAVAVAVEVGVLVGMVVGVAVPASGRDGAGGADLTASFGATAPAASLRVAAIRRASSRQRPPSGATPSQLVALQITS